MISDGARQRLVERHCAATIRALSNLPGAEYRRQKLILDGKGVVFHVPHLAVSAVDDSIARNRGVADAIALRLIYSDPAIHQRGLPDSAIGRLVFDILEQLRCESLVMGNLAGIEANLDVAFNEWCRESRGNGLVENEVGLLIYTVTQIARSRLTGKPQDEEVEGLIESVRFRLAPVVGDDLARLSQLRGDQQSYAVHAANIADAINEIAGSLGAELADRHLAALRSRNLLPPANEQDDKYVESEDVGGEARSPGDLEGDGYRVFCRDFDRQVTGSSLYRAEQRRELRLHLDRMIAAQAVSIPRLAQRFKFLFSVPKRAGWHEGEEEGYIDGRRLSQLVAQPGYTRVFRKEKYMPVSDTVVSFLVDNSGSMKRQRFEAVAVLLDIYCRALELAGVSTELLGFTTGGWAGGESIKAWKQAGSPENPGRLNDRLHIVYKSGDDSWRRSRYSISAMLNPVHFREGLDGEALQWAVSRLQERPEPRKCLVLISDGAPMETATSNANDEFYLDRHLRNVAIKTARDPGIELAAIGIALDMNEYFDNCMTLDLTGTLGHDAFRALEHLFSATPNTVH